MTLWVRIRSWHALATVDGKTLCGRYAPVDSDTDTELPAAKSCESCLRIIARKKV